MTFFAMRAPVAPQMPHLNASAIAQDLDRSLAAWIPQGLRAAYLQHGCAIVRDAVPKELIVAFRSAATRLYELKGNPRHIYDADFTAAFGSDATLYSLVGDARLVSAIKAIFGDQPYGLFPAVIRRVAGAAEDLGWEAPSDIHLDAQVHGPRMTVNFWIPLESCGRNRPTLRLVPMGYRAARGFVGFSPMNRRPHEEFFSGHFRSDAGEELRLRAMLGDDYFIDPVMDTGDLVMLSNWTLHGGCRSRDMRFGLVAAELRFGCDGLNQRIETATMILRGARSRTADHE